MLYRHHSTASAASSARKLVWGSWIQVMLNFEGRVAIGRRLDPQISESVDEDCSEVDELIASGEFLKCCRWSETKVTQSWLG
jgi:hypothetical protein